MQVRIYEDGKSAGKDVMYQGRTFCQNCGPGEVNPLKNIGCYRGNNMQHEEVREATSCRRAVSLRWFPEQPNLEDEIYSKGGRFVTPWFSQLFLFRGSSRFCRWYGS